MSAPRKKPVLHRYRITVLYALDDRLRWAADPAGVYVVERWRYVYGHTGTCVEYLLTQPGRRGTVDWVNEADLEPVEDA